MDELDTIPKRLLFLRELRKLSMTDVTLKLGNARRTLFAHESGDRKIKAGDLNAYAKLYDVPVETLAEGRHLVRFFDRGGNVDEEALAALHKVLKRELRRALRQDGEQAETTNRIRLQLAALKDGRFRTEWLNSINQDAKLADLNSSNRWGSQYIAVLSATDLRQIRNWADDSAVFTSTRTMPATSHSRAAQSRFAYEIPENDHSMVAKEGVSFNPGTPLYINPQAVINPGNYVLVQLVSIELPLFRIFRAARPLRPGEPFGKGNPFVPFTLTALNPAYEDLKVSEAAELSDIALVVGAYLPLIS